MKATFKSTIQGLRHHDGIVNIISKYDVSENFLSQVIKDWVDKKISDDYRLSKNVPMR